METKRLMTTGLSESEQAPDARRVSAASSDIAKRCAMGVALACSAIHD